MEFQAIGGATPFAGSGLFLVEVTHQDNQTRSFEEVDSVVSIARSLLQARTSWTNADGESPALEANDILVVAPYNAQLSALRLALAEMGVVRLGTVDKFQGPVAPVVRWWSIRAPVHRRKMRRAGWHSSTTRTDSTSRPVGLGAR
jgi:uncharacterized protein